jgi:hypothetical protein
MPRALSKRDQALKQNADDAHYAKLFGKEPLLQVIVPELRTRTPKPKVGLSELQEQIRVVTWWNKHCAEHELPPYALFSIPNGAALSSPYGSANLKLSGMRDGIEDLFLAHQKGKWAGLFIEMKKHDGAVSDEQLTVSLFHLKQGYKSVVAWSHEEAIQEILDYLIPF